MPTYPIIGAAAQAAIDAAVAQRLLAEKAAADARNARLEAQRQADIATAAADVAQAAQADAASAAADAASATSGVEAATAGKLATEAAAKAAAQVPIALAAKNAAHAAASTASSAKSTADAAAAAALAASQQVTPNPPAAVDAAAAAADFAADATVDATQAQGPIEDQADAGYDNVVAANAAAQASATAATGQVAGKSSASVAAALTAKTNTDAAVTAVFAAMGQAEAQRDIAIAQRDIAVAKQEEARQLKTAGDNSGALGAAAAASGAFNAATAAATQAANFATVAQTNSDTAVVQANLANDAAKLAGDPQADTYADQAALAANTSKQYVLQAQDAAKAAAAAADAANQAYGAAAINATVSVADAVSDAANRAEASAATAKAASAEALDHADNAQAFANTAIMAGDAAVAAQLEAAAAAQDAEQKRQAAEDTSTDALIYANQVEAGSTDPAVAATATGYAQKAIQQAAEAEAAAKLAGEKADRVEGQLIVAESAAADAEREAGLAAQKAAEAEAAAQAAEQERDRIALALAANPTDPALIAASAKADAAANAARADADAADTAQQNAQSAAQDARSSADAADAAAVAARADRQNAAAQAAAAKQASVDTANTAISVAETIATNANELADSAPGRVTEDASKNEMDALNKELAAEQALITALGDSPAAEGAKLKLKETQARLAAAIAAHDRSAFVFSARAAYRLERRTDGKKGYKATPTIARFTSPTPDAVAGLNRPYIQILKEGQGDEQTATGDVEKKNLIDNFILTAVNVIDAEKMDVVETFGNPHFFASGRFAKKVTLNGYVRSEPRVPALTTGFKNVTTRDGQSRSSAAQIPMKPADKSDVISDFVIFRNFYDNYLRSTKLAETGGYARIFIDGDYFDGFVQVLQFGRSSDIDSVVPWSMQFIAFRHWHADDAGASDILKTLIKDTGARKPALSDRQAEAEIKDAGTCELFVGDFGSNDMSAKTVAVSDVITLTEDGKSSNLGTTAKRAALLLKQTPMALSCSLQGELTGAAELVYEDSGDSVNGSTPPLDSPQALKLKVLNYSRLRDAYLKNVGALRGGSRSYIPPAEAAISLVFSLKPSAGTPCTVTYRVSASGDSILKPSNVVVTARSTATPKKLADSIVPSAASSAATAFSASVSSAVDAVPVFVAADGTVTLEIAMDLIDNAGSPIRISDPATFTAEVDKATLAAATADGVALKDPPDSGVTATLTGTVQKNGLTGGKLVVTVTGKVPGWANGVSPTKFADGLLTTITMKLGGSNGYQAATLTLKVTQKLPPAAGLANLFRSIRKMEDLTDAGNRVGLAVKLLFTKPQAGQLPNAVLAEIRKLKIAFATDDSGDGNLTGGMIALDGSSASGTVVETAGRNATFSVAPTTSPAGIRQVDDGVEIRAYFALTADADAAARSGSVYVSYDANTTTVSSGVTAAVGANTFNVRVADLIAGALRGSVIDLSVMNPGPFVSIPSK